MSHNHTLSGASSGEFARDIAPFSLLVDVSDEGEVDFTELQHILDRANVERDVEFPFFPATISRLTRSIIEFNDRFEALDPEAEQITGHPFTEQNKQSIEVVPGHGITFNDPKFLTESWMWYQEGVGLTVQRAAIAVLDSISETHPSLASQELVKY
jgi:hypothetical protein